MSLTDKLTTSLRNAALGTAVATASIVEAAPSSDTHPDEKHTTAAEQSTYSDDLGMQFDVLSGALRSEKFYPKVNSTEQEIKFAEAVYAKPMAERRAEADQFLVQNYDQLKAKFASDWAIQQARFPTIKVGDVIPDEYYQSQDRFNGFKQLTGGLYERLKKKDRLGTISQDEQKVLSDITPASPNSPTPQQNADLYGSFIMLKQEAQKGGKEAQENYADFLITSYAQLKERLNGETDKNSGIEDERLKNFNTSMQELYQSLSVKREKGTATETEKRVLTAISGAETEALDKLKQKARTYPETNPVDQPFYSMFTNLMEQVDHQQELCHIHPDTRLRVANGIMKYGDMLSQKTDHAKIGWLEINPNKLHKFLQETGSKIDATNGLQVVLNHPTDKNIGFTLNVRQEDIAQAARSGQQAYNCIKSHVDPETAKELAGMMDFFSSVPTPEKIKKLKENFGQIMKKYQDQIPEGVKKEFESHLKQATSIPFEVTVRDKNGSRKATKDDADLFLTTLVDNAHALDKKGVLDLSDLVSHRVAKDSKIGRGIVSFVYKAANFVSDPVRSAMEEPVKKAFYSMIETRDKNDTVVPTNRDILIAHSSPVKVPEIAQGTTTAQNTDKKKSFDVIAMAQSGGRG